MRCAGFNNVDLAAAREFGLTVARVPAYSPHAVAEHTMAIILGLNRKIHRAYKPGAEGNFALDGLLGFDLHARRWALSAPARSAKCSPASSRVLAAGSSLRSAAQSCLRSARHALWALEEVFSASDILSLNCPLTPETRHMIREETLPLLKPGVMLINTGRGGVIDTRAVIDGLKSGRIGALGLDVYEEEADLFFEDLSSQVLRDDVFARLLTFPNVLITGHQAFITREALDAIAETTLGNIVSFRDTGFATHSVSVERLAGHG